MSQLSREDFKCNCGKCDQQCRDSELNAALEDVVTHFEHVKYNVGPVRIVVHCVNRCLDYNRKQNSKDSSYHVIGLAADFHLEGVTHREIYDYLCSKYPGMYGIICYSWGIHLDVGKGGINVSPRPYRKNHVG